VSVGIVNIVIVFSIEVWWKKAERCEAAS